MKEEIWKDVVGFEKYYQVSNFGRIKSLERFVENGTNGSLTHLQEKILKTFIHPIGYIIVQISNKMLKKQSKIVHRLVAQAFLPNPHNKKTVNHKDGIKSNNNIENLEWATHSENEKHAYNTGLKDRKTVKRKVLMLSLDDEPLLWFDSIKEASDETGCFASNISKCISGKYKTSRGYKWRYYNGK